MNKKNRLRGLAAIGAGLALSSSAFAEKYDVGLRNSGSTATPVQQEMPAYPAELADSGQEGWVRMHFVIGPDGQAIDPIVIDSSGGAGFETEARKALEQWRFEAPEAGGEDAHNVVNIRSEVRGSRDSATKGFRKDHERIVLNLVHERNDDARENVDELFEKGGFNMYESTALWLMAGRVDGVEGNDAGKLECYRRALAVSTKRSLGPENRKALMAKIFQLEDEAGQYSAALTTFRSLDRFSTESEVDEELQARADEIRALVDGDEDLVASATVYNPCNCEAGESLWYYKPARRTFSFANLNGNVTRFEARCEKQRIQGAMETGKTWTLAPEWGNCRVFVFGDDGAQFDFVEHAAETQEDASTPVARDDVLDRRNRGQQG